MDKMPRTIPALWSFRALLIALLASALLIWAIFAAAAEEPGIAVDLVNGHKLRVKEIDPARSLPHAYYDQAMTSLPVLYPAGRVLAERRLGKLGENPAAAYALVGYQKDLDDPVVIIAGVVTRGNRAWSFDADVPQDDFGDMLLLVMEVLTRLPVDRVEQP